jgi:pimeloyl-ACP methyl ester carboxylesterase
MRPLLLVPAFSLLLPGLALAETREPVRIPAGDVVLAGELVLPAGPPRAAVVLVQGAGPHGRDQVISGAPMFGQLAEQLAARGVASLRIDNAGGGESTGETPRHFRDRIPHITAALDLLAGHPAVSTAPIGLLAHSEGTFVAGEVWSARDAAIDFLVLLGAPGRQGREVWVDQQSNPERFPDRSAEDLARIRDGFDRVALASISGDRAAVETATDSLFAIIGLSPEELAEVRPGFVDRMASPEMQVLLGHDPAPAFGRVTDPVLAVWGGVDPLTAPALNLPPFLAQRHPDSRLTAVVLPDEEHFFLRGEGLEPGEHAFGKMNLSPRLVSTIDHWLGGETFAD